MTVSRGETTFSALTPGGQFRRLTRLAREAIAAFDLGPVSLTPLHYVTTATYRVRQAITGTDFVLRIHDPTRDAAAVASELAWLEALQTDIPGRVPAPVRLPSGELTTMGHVPGVPEPRHCSLVTWIEGRRPGKRLGASTVRGMGALMAELHQAGRRFAPPPGFARPRYDVDGLLRPPGWAHLTPRQSELFRAVGDRLATVAAELGDGREVFGLIHGDLHGGNVVCHQGQVRAIDFDDGGYGWYLYDLAIALEVMEWRPDYAALRSALLAGYRSVAELPAEHDAHLDAFVLARWVFLGLSFLSRPDQARFRAYAPRFMAIVEPKLAAYLAAGA